MTTLLRRLCLFSSLLLGALSALAADTPAPSRHLIDRTRAQTNAPVNYHVSVAYEVPRRESLRFDYVARRTAPNR